MMTKQTSTMISVLENKKDTTVAAAIRNNVYCQEVAPQSEEESVISAARALLGLSPTAHGVSPVLTSVSRQAPRMPMFLELPSSLVSSSESSSDISLDGAGSEDSENESSSTTKPYYTGSISLALPDDEESLSPLHCFMRRYCVEAFTATEEDISTSRHGKCHGGRIVVGQVGIRCLHCKQRPAHQKQERATCFPSSLRNIYHSIETWQRRHSLVCQDIPFWVKKSMAELMDKSRAGGGGRRQFWQESAERLGLANTPHGIRFISAPGDLAPVGDDVSESSRTNKEPSVPVVEARDKQLVTDYLFLLLDQMEACQFTEQDRAGGRSKVKDYSVGYPGMQCKHCAGKAGFGRYFPANLHALTSANSDRNIHNHITKCRRCPEEVRDELKRLQQEQSQCKNRRGSRKLFFERIFTRLHGPAVSEV